MQNTHVSIDFCCNIIICTHIPPSMFYRQAPLSPLQLSTLHAALNLGMGRIDKAVHNAVMIYYRMVEIWTHFSSTQVACQFY